MTTASVGREHLETLAKLFGRSPVAVLADMRRALGTSCRTVVRALSRLGYLTSYSHAGRYYTLRRIPTFDPQGLWCHGEARFSAHGTLRATVVFLVKDAVAGYTHEELQHIVGLRVHDTLRRLVEEAQLGRALVETLFVYVDVAPERAAAQLAQRRRAAATTPAVPPARPPLEPARVIDVLVAVIHHPGYALARLARELQARGVQVTAEQVELVLVTYGVKKTARSRSRRSPRCGRRPPR